MALDVSSSVGGSSSGFDFNSQPGVLGVLAAIRASAISSAEKNELRDLVFLYSNGGGDIAVRTMLEERLRNYAIVPVVQNQNVTAGTGVPSSAVQQTYTEGFSSGRPAPSFAPSPMPVVQPKSAILTPTPTPTPTLVASEPVTPPAPRVVVQVPVPPVAVVIPTIPGPVSEMAPAPAVPEIVSPAPTPTPGITEDSLLATSRLDRIRVIKADINARVGNPVTLVDIDNNLGREYMAALLDAMKLLSTASEEESAKAMGRLETVYALVKEVLDTRGGSADMPPSTSVPTQAINPAMPVSSVFSQNQVVEKVVLEQPVAVAQSQYNANSTDRMPVREAATASDTRWGEQSQSEVTPVPQAPQPGTQEWQKIEQLQNGVDVQDGEIEQVDASQIQRVVSPLVSMAEKAAPAISIAQNVSPLFADKATQIVSVAQSAAPLLSMHDLPTADDVAKASITDDPLYTKEVDEGLNQLLSEWSLFKKSGLFGTGPHGREHPLFHKISGIQIPLILSGRFEGATQEIKQSVTDYMNGWRYEQGIVYQPMETFEQYLRRVIRHIIDLQNKRRGT